MLLAFGQFEPAQAVELPDPAVIEAQMAELNADVPGSIWALNPFRNAHEGTGADGTTYRLTSLNPSVNSWFVLEVAPVSGRARAYHLENGDPDGTLIALQDGDAPSLVIDQSGVLTECAPWDDDSLQTAANLDLPFAPICDWAVFVRNPVRGNRTTREAVSQFLRDNVIFGDSIVNLIKGAFFEDAFMVSSEGFETAEQISGVDLLGTALLSQTPSMRPAMGFDLEGTEGGAMTAGRLVRGQRRAGHLCLGHAARHDRARGASGAGRQRAGRCGKPRRCLPCRLRHGAIRDRL